MSMRNKIYAIDLWSVGAKRSTGLLAAASLPMSEANLPFAGVGEMKRSARGLIWSVIASLSPRLRLMQTVAEKGWAGAVGAHFPTR